MTQKFTWWFLGKINREDLDVGGAIGLRVDVITIFGVDNGFDSFSSGRVCNDAGVLEALSPDPRRELCKSVVFWLLLQLLSVEVVVKKLRRSKSLDFKVARMKSFQTLIIVNWTFVPTMCSLKFYNAMNFWKQISL